MNLSHDNNNDNINSSNESILSIARHEELPEPIKQTEHVIYKFSELNNNNDNNNDNNDNTNSKFHIKKYTFLHTLGPDPNPLIDWEHYTLTSYSTHQPNISLSNNINDSSQSQSTKTQNQPTVLTNINRSEFSKATLTQLYEVNQMNPTSNEPNYIPLKKLSKAQSRYLIWLGKFQLKVGNWFHLNDWKIWGERNLFIGNGGER